LSEGTHWGCLLQLEYAILSSHLHLNQHTLLLFCACVVLQVQQVQQRAIAADGYRLYGFKLPLVAMLIQVQCAVTAQIVVL
jgi:hypothetical protein